MKLPDLICLFHGLSGMCFGWMNGVRTNALSGLFLSAAGLLAGIVTGFFLGRLHRAMRLALPPHRPTERLFAGTFSLLGVVFGAAFWWVCLVSVLG